MSSTKVQKLDGFRCEICNGEDFLPINFTSYLMSTKSYAPQVNDYINYICDTCGTITPYPIPDMAVLAEYYNQDYREDPYAINAEFGRLELPIEIPWSGISFLRFKSFQDAVIRNRTTYPELCPTPDDVIVDYGAYQGMFLSAAKQAWGCDGIAYDFNQKGIAFARQSLGFERSVVAKDIYADTFDTKVRFAVLVHSFEHLQYPHRFLNHLKQNILLPSGWLYIEVPNPFGFSLADPTHFYTYPLESLCYVMEKNGFQVIESWVSGYPVLPDNPHQSPVQNLHVLARASDTPLDAVIPKTNAIDIRRRIRSAYRRFTWNFVLSEFARVGHQVIRLPVHVWRFIKRDLLS